MVFYWTRGRCGSRFLPGALRVIAPKVGNGMGKSPQATDADLPTPIAPAVTDKAYDKNESLPQPELTAEN